MQRYRVILTHKSPKKAFHWLQTIILNIVQMVLCLVLQQNKKKKYIETILWIVRKIKKIVAMLFRFSVELWAVNRFQMPSKRNRSLFTSLWPGATHSYFCSKNSKWIKLHLESPFTVERNTCITNATLQRKVVTPLLQYISCLMLSVG